MNLRKLALGLAVVGALGFAPTKAEAVTLGLTCITGNSAGSCAAGEAGLVVDVTESAGQVTFEFRYGTGLSAQTVSALGTASIAQVYFDQPDTAMLTFSSLSESAGVDFNVGANPNNLPGGSSVTPNFVATSAYGAVSPAASNGVNYNPTTPEYLRVVFSLAAKPGGGLYTFQEVLQALQNGSLRVGMHTISFAGGYSEGFMTGFTPDTPVVPEPATLLLLGSGLAGAAGIARRRRRQSAAK